VAEMKPDTADDSKPIEADSPPLEELEQVPDEKPLEELDEDDEVLDLTDMDAVDPEPLFEQQAYQTPQPEPVLEHAVTSPVMMPKPPNIDSGLVSRSPATEAIEEFAKLGEKLYEEDHELPIGNGAITLEHLTRELVRPMLKEWLDQHLPMTVERLVREEIERLVLQSQRKDPW